MGYGVHVSHTLRDIVVGPLARRAAPGGVLLYGDGGAVVETISFGATRTMPRDGARVVTADMIYDVASVTKVAATMGVLLKLVERGDIALDTRASRLVPELRSPGSDAITIAHLAGHGSGLPAHFELFRRLLAGERDGADTARAALLRMCGGAELEAAPGEQVRYSDLGYIVLGAALERAGGKRLDLLAEELVYGPLRMARTGFVDLTGEVPTRTAGDVVPTEVCPYRGLVQGEVHDGNAHAAGGVCGHAGLFSTASDLGRFAAAIVAAAAGASGSYFSTELVTTCFTTWAAPGHTRRLGWDTPSHTPGVSHAGDLWPRAHTYGHLGFTGASLWHHHPTGRFAVLLTNRVNPTRLRTGIKDLRRAVMDAVWQTLEA